MGAYRTEPALTRRVKKQAAEVIRDEMKAWNIIQGVQPGAEDSNLLKSMNSIRKPDAVSPELAALRKKFSRSDFNEEEVADAASTTESSAESTTEILRVAPAKAGVVDDHAQARAKSVVIKGDEIIGEQG